MTFTWQLINTGTTTLGGCGGLDVEIASSDGCGVAADESPDGDMMNARTASLDGLDVGTSISDGGGTQSTLDCGGSQRSDMSGGGAGGGSASEEIEGEWMLFTRVCV